MKKLVISLVVLLTAMQANAQSKASLDAAKAVDKAKAEVENPKKATSPQTWVKLGNTYMDAFDAPIKGIWPGASQTEVKMILKDQPIVSSTQEEINGVTYILDTYEDKTLYYDQNGVLTAWVVKVPALNEDILSLSYQSFQKAQTLDAKGSAGKAIGESLKALQTKYQNEGLSAYAIGKYAEASKDFEMAANVAANPAIGLVDSTMAYYAAITAAMAGENARAIELLNNCIAINYVQNGDVYSTLSEAYKNSGDTIKAKEILATGFAKYPSNQGILVSLINIYLESNDNPEKVLEFLKVAQANEPTNASLFYAEGNVYKKLNRFDEAIASFQKSAQVDPNYFFAPFSEGDAYYSKAIDLQNQAQAEADDAKFATLNAQMEQALEDAIIPFEKAFELTQDNDLKSGCAEYLKQIYFRFRDKKDEYLKAYEKYNKFLEENK